MKVKERKKKIFSNLCPVPMNTNHIAIRFPTESLHLFSLDFLSLFHQSRNKVNELKHREAIRSHYKILLVMNYSVSTPNDKPKNERYVESFGCCHVRNYNCCCCFFLSLSPIHFYGRFDCCWSQTQFILSSRSVEFKLHMTTISQAIVKP